MNSNSFAKIILSNALIIYITLFAGCKTDDPQKEDVPELITKVTLTFTPTGGSTVTATATDADGLGLLPLKTDGAINLTKNTSYILTITMINALADSSAPEYNITDEVEEEGDEHMFFFSWTNNVFSDPLGNGNLDLREDDVNYDDEDVNNLPIGLTTLWTTTDIVSSGTFRIVLKHQPDLKSTSSSSADGETDLDVDFEVNVN